MPLAAGFRPDTLGELERCHRPPSPQLGVPTSKGGKEWNGKRDGRGLEKGMEKRQGEEGWKGKNDLHPTLFVGPA